jgi:hypothetical protein
VAEDNKLRTDDGTVIGTILYAVVKGDGTLSRKSMKDHGGFKIYDTAAKAKNNCRSDGDAVVRLIFNMREEPIFIRRKKLL